MVIRQKKVKTGNLRTENKSKETRNVKDKRITICQIIKQNLSLLMPCNAMFSYKMIIR